MDVDGGHAEREARDLHIRAHRDLVAGDHGHLEARTAHLDQHLIPLAVAVTDEHTRRRARGGPRADREHRPLLDLGHTRRSTGNLHDQEVLLIAIVAKELGDLGQIVCDRGTDVGAQHCGAGPRVFPNPGQDVSAQCRIGARHFLGEDRLYAPFVHGIDHRPHQAHGDRVDAFLFEVGERTTHAVFVERFLNFAGIEHAFGYAQAQVARDQRLGRQKLEVVAIRLVAVAEVQDVAEALGVKDPHLGATAIDDGIGGDGGAVDDVVATCDELRDIQTLLPSKVPHAVEDGLLGCSRRTRHLPDLKATHLGREDEIGERAADIDAKANAHECRFPRRRSGN